MTILEKKTALQEERSCCLWKQWFTQTCMFFSLKRKSRMFQLFSIQYKSVGTETKLDPIGFHCKENKWNILQNVFFFYRIKKYKQLNIKILPVLMHLSLYKSFVNSLYVSGCKYFIFSFSYFPWMFFCVWKSCLLNS